jgi:hypothetical protein
MTERAPRVSALDALRAAGIDDPTALLRTLAASWPGGVSP